MPARRSPKDVSLHDFLAGLFAGLALKDVREVLFLGLGPALVQTVASAANLQARLRLRLGFRLVPGALERRGSTLVRALDGLVDEGVLGREGDRFRIQLDRVTGAVVLTGLRTPLDYHARCARAFLRAHATARVRASLEQLRRQMQARRPEARPPKP